MERPHSRYPYVYARQTQGPSTAQNCRKDGNSAPAGMTVMNLFPREVNKESDAGTLFGLKSSLQNSLLIDRSSHRSSS